MSSSGSRVVDGLAGRFAALVLTLLAAGAVTCGAGFFGLRRLEGSLEGVVGTDVARLMTITDIRRSLRSLVLLERDQLLEADPGKAAALAGQMATGQVALDGLLATYEQFLMPEDAGRWRLLREEHQRFVRLDREVAALSKAGRRTEATALSQTQSKAWEGVIKELIAEANQRLRVKAAETRAVYLWARAALVLVFVLSAILGLVAGLVVYRGIKQMLREILALKDRLVEANEGLERLVEERTSTIRAILDHVRFGFFLVGRDLRITDGCTRSALLLLGHEALTGRRVAEALGFTGHAAANFDGYVEQVFDDILPEELSCDQIPSRLERHGSVLRVQVSVVRDGEGKVAQLLFCVSDVTSLEEAERANRESRALLAVLKNPLPFQRFVADVNERFGSIREALSHTDEPRVRRELHTIKGNAHCFGLTELATRAHDIEGAPKIELPPVLDLEREFDNFLAGHFDVLGIRSLGDAREALVRVSDVALEELESLLDTPVPQGQDPSTWQAALRGRVASLRARPLRELLGPLPQQVQGLSQRLGKEVELHVRGGDIVVPPGRLAPVLSVLTHALRNALDHGIEPPHERGDKPACGSLELLFEDRPTSWRVTVADDGRGIDLVKLHARAVERGLIAPEQRLSQKELCALVFAPKLSTADTVSDISGRGEGMAALADAVERCHGRIDVQTTPGHGTRIIMDLPKDPSVAVHDESRGHVLRTTASPAA